MEVGLSLVILSLFCAGAVAQSGCTNVLENLSPCLNYITGSATNPSSGCCTQFSGVVKSSPQCLCQILNGGASSLGINVNRTQALALPTACKVQTPPSTQCNAADSPAGSSNSNPSGTENSIKLSIPLLFVVFAATYASTFRTY
ncbi:non-specific lipid transfer protein GPI-anchored 5-like isoform X1 [Cicer arietinum]|uniref:non-specific lipid transfer protein GPI-anchored 5-like isoform X1 n=1 Tax=Cicer arietinum TaxID=3827 RepID=UPI00032A990B